MAKEPDKSKKKKKHQEKKPKKTRYTPPLVKKLDVLGPEYASGASATRIVACVAVISSGSSGSSMT